MPPRPLRRSPESPLVCERAQAYRAILVVDDDHLHRGAVFEEPIAPQKIQEVLPCLLRLFVVVEVLENREVEPLHDSRVACEEDVTFV